jgi:superoxide reductase
MKKLELYKCDICGNIVEIVISGGGELVCCGQPMKKLEPQHEEEALTEKHVPVFSIKENGTTEIRVGEVLHPMINEHYIMFIESISKDETEIKRKYFYPGEEPKMHSCKSSDEIYAREYCNIHGLWGTKND